MDKKKTLKCEKLYISEREREREREKENFQDRNLCKFRNNDVFCACRKWWLNFNTLLIMLVMMYFMNNT